jgi:uncharacterized membrane protein HdeD (DUF308 family)
MDFETVIWGYFPILVGIAEIIGSTYMTHKKRKGFGFITSFLVWVFNGIAIFILFEMLNNSYPSYIPYFLILISTVFLVYQILKKKKKKHLPTKN